MKRKHIVLLKKDALERARLEKGLFRKEIQQQARISPSSAWRAFTKGEAGIRVARAICQVLGLELKDVWDMERAL